MFESNYTKIFAGNFIVAQLVFDKLEGIGINPILKDDNQTGVTAVLAEDYQSLIEVYVHNDELEKAVPIVEEVVAQTSA